MVNGRTKECSKWCFENKRFMKKFVGLWNELSECAQKDRIERIEQCQNEISSHEINAAGNANISWDRANFLQES